MKPLFNRYLLLCLAALLIVTAFVGCRQTPGGTDGTEGSDDVTSDVVEKPTAPVTDPDVESEESDTATETSGETDEETDNGDETPGEIIWEPDVLAWYDVDHGSSVNSRPDHGWDPLYQQSPGLVTKGGIFRSATPLLGTYDQIDPVVAKQHLYWLGAAGFDAVVVDITNYNARETGEDFQRYMRGLINNTKVLLQAAKDMTAEGYPNVPQVVIAPRLFGTDFEALKEILEKIYQLQSEYPGQVYRMAEESKPLVLVFCDWAVFDDWGNRPPEDVDDRMDIRFCNGYLDRYGVFDKETGGWAISDKRNMFLFVENKKGETEGSYAPIYTVGKDGKPEVMCSSVSVHGGWNSDGSNWDAMNNLIGGKTPFERTLEPVYAIRPDVVIVNRFNYPVAWMEQPQEGLGLYHSGHFEPCEELGFEVYNHVQQQVYALKSLKGNAPAKPEVVSDASNRLLLALDGNPMEYRISESKSFEGAEWLYYHISEGVDYSYLASLDQIWVQTRNSFGESEAVLVDVNGEFTGDAGSYTVEFNQVSFSPAPAWQENPFSHTALPAEVTNGTAAYIMMPKGSSVGFTVRIGTAGTYRLILRCVTDNQGPTIRFAVDGVDTRNKVCMANSGNGWTYTEFDLGLVTMAAGKHEITITALDQSNQAFVLDNLYILLAEEGETEPEPEPEETEPEETEPPIDADYIFELDELTFDPAPAWSEIPYSHVLLPAEVSDGRAAHMTLNLNQETGVVIDVDKAGSYMLTLNVVTNTNGPVLKVFVDGHPLGAKVVMSNTVGSWTYESIDLGVVTLDAGDHVLSFRSVDVASNASFILDNVYLNEVDPAETDVPTTDEPTTDEPTPDEPTPEPPQELIFEFDTLTYNPMPHWHEIPYTHGALPDGVTDKRTANMSLNLGEEVSVTLTVEKAGTYALVLHAVTNTNGPILQFAVNGQDVGGKVKMAYGGQWGYATFNLGYVTLNAGENTLSFRSVDVASDASFMLDNLVLTPVDMDAETEFSYEFDEMTFVTYPSWMDKPFVNGALPADVTDGKAIFATIRKDAETVMTFSVPADGTYSIIFKGVTDNNGPTFQFFVDGNAIGSKVNMANGGSGWTFTSFDLGKLTLTAGVHTLSICGVDVDSESPCVMDRLVLVPTNP